MKSVSLFYAFLAVVLVCVLLTGCGKPSTPTETPTKAPAGNESVSRESGDIATEAAPVTSETQTPGSPSSSSPSDDASSGAADGNTTEPVSAPTDDQTTETPSEDQVLDMEAFLLDLTARHPKANAEDLCDEILKSSYFSLFSKMSVEYYWPYFDFSFKPAGLRGAYSVTDVSGEAVLIVAVPEDGVDPASIVNDLNGHISRPQQEGAPDMLLIKEIGGKIFCAIYYGDMRPITVYAQNGRDYVNIFHDYLAKHPDAGCLEMAKFFASRQKIGRMYHQSAEEGALRGFGVWDEASGWYKPVDIAGFADAARFEPMMEPNAFMGYVFRVRDGVDVNTFARTLRENANLAYNVCTSVNTVFTETDGNYVLFVMCNEKK